MFDCPYLDVKIWSSTTCRVNIIREFLQTSKTDANRANETKYIQQEAWYHNLMVLS